MTNQYDTGAAAAFFNNARQAWWEHLREEYGYGRTTADREKDEQYWQEQRGRGDD